MTSELIKNTRGRPRKVMRNNVEVKVIEFANTLRTVRLLAGESQQTFAQRLAVTQPMLSNLESGLREPWPDLVFEIERQLGLCPGDLSRKLGYMPVTTEKETHGQPI